MPYKSCQFCGSNWDNNWSDYGVWECSDKNSILLLHSISICLCNYFISHQKIFYVHIYCCTSL